MLAIEHVESEDVSEILRPYCKSYSIL
jgi:hypothetical protein